MINKKALAFRELGTITLRYNSKNARKPYPTIVHYHKNGDSSGVLEYLQFWTANRYDGMEEERARLKNDGKTLAEPE